MFVIRLLEYPLNLATESNATPKRSTFEAQIPRALSSSDSVDSPIKPPLKAFPNKPAVESSRNKKGTFKVNVEEVDVVR